MKLLKGPKPRKSSCDTIDQQINKRTLHKSNSRPVCNSLMSMNASIHCESSACKHRSDLAVEFNGTIVHMASTDLEIFGPNFTTVFLERAPFTPPTSAASQQTQPTRDSQ